MKTIYTFIILLFSINHISATEIRAVMVEPYPPIITREDSIRCFWEYETYHSSGSFCAPQCFKFYDTLLRYDNCPCLPEDTVTQVHWLLRRPDGALLQGLDTTVDKGTVFYRCYDYLQGPSWEFSAYGGSYVTQYPGSFYTVDFCYQISKFSIKEIMDSCNYKKLEITDSSEHIGMRYPDTKWFICVRDSLHDIIQIDSGIEISPLIDSGVHLIIRERSKPIIELTQAGVYSIEYILWQFVPNGNPPITDTATIHNIRVTPCKDTTTVKDVWLPTAFSPNNDGVNDLLKIYSNSILSEFELKIYNRWGNVVFTSNDIDNSWNGEYKNVNAPQDVYGYLLIYKTINSKQQTIKKGMFTLLR